MARLTDARRAVWASIDNWSGFSGELAFRTKFRYEDAGAMQGDEPSITHGNVPAIAIHPSGPSPSSWVTNRGFEFLYTLDVRFYTPLWSVNKGEALYEEFINACYGCCPPGSTVPYIQAATGSPPANIGSLTVTKRHTGKGGDGPIITLWSTSITVRVRFQPGV